VDPFYRPTRAEISLDALGQNIEAFRSAIPSGTKLLACVKANAYGHGAVEIAREAVRRGVDYLSVAFLDEAIQLRRADIQAPILILGYTPPEAVRTAVEHNVTITVFSEEVLEAAAGAAAATGMQARIHIKVDTGMGRIGLNPEQEAVPFIEKALQQPGVLVEGVYTHYAKADEADKTYTRSQYRRLMAVADYFRAAGYELPIVHAGNSAAGIDTPELTGDMLRLGIGLYGLYPSDEVNRKRVALKPVLTLKTALAMVKTVPRNTGISYGTIYVTQTEERIGTLPVGYADGFSRLLSGRAHVLVRGRRVPVVGRICMDQCMVRLDGLPSDVRAGEEVVLIGCQQKETITVEELAQAIGTIPYEVVCQLAARVPRVYRREGRPVAVAHPLLQ
jgi:alanine racemase